MTAAKRHESCGLACPLAERLPEVGGDAAQLQQVLLNLARNAAESMSGGTAAREVIVRTADRGDRQVSVSVPDSARRSRRGACADLQAVVTARSRTAWAWGSPSAARSSKPMRAVLAERRREGGLAVQFTLPYREKRIMSDDADVYVVDDDELLRKTLERLMASGGGPCRPSPRPTSSWAKPLPDRDRLRVPRRQDAGAERSRAPAGAHRSGDRLPILFLTGHGDVPTTVRAMKAGRDGLHREALQRPGAARRHPSGAGAGRERWRSVSIARASNGGWRR